MLDNHVDGCELDFAAEPTSDDEIQRLLVTPPEKPPLAFRLLAAATSGGRDLGLANRLRAAGLSVREVNGWQTRGFATLNPRGALTHHTAGAPRSAGVAPSLGIIINGRSDLPGPLANVYIDYDGVVYVIASGKANHAGIVDNGRVAWAPDGSGNSLVWGLEVEHPGTFPLPDKIADIAARVQAAVVRGTVGADRVIYHKEWAPSRKIDLATAPSPLAHRQLVATYLTTPKPEDDKMWTPERFEKVKAWVRWRLTENADEARKPDLIKDFNPGDPDWALAEWMHETIGLYGSHSRYRGWRGFRLLGITFGNAPERIPRAWWTAINDDIAFANAYADKADDPLQQELAAKTVEVVRLQDQVTVLAAELEAARDNDTTDDARIEQLEATLAAVRGQLEAIVASLG